MSARAEPLSIESLLQKQREEKEAAAKVFSTLSPSFFFLTVIHSPDS